MVGRDAAGDAVERPRREGEALRVGCDERYVAALPLRGQRSRLAKHFRSEVGSDDLPHLRRKCHSGVPPTGGYVKEEMVGFQGETGKERNNFV